MSNTEAATRLRLLARLAADKARIVAGLMDELSRSLLEDAEAMLKGANLLDEKDGEKWVSELRA